MGNCHPEKTNVHRGEASIIAVNNYYIILNVNYITFGFKTIRSSENLS